ncbi:hypothetical protein BGZ63DRAFT_417646 [Mariannaea sp. PMI_226]|nr:hypothetical protein BGZ63DRAFT_417646 [Mariannaea sp. PMI_226]
MESSAAPQPALENSAGKVRILLQTFTHLVPGSDLPQHLWKRDFDSAQERIIPYRDHFGLDKIECFFLFDHHGHDHTVPEEKVPVLWYKWTGESLIRVYEELPSKIQKELRKWPFTWEGRKFHKLQKGPDGEYDPEDRREIIKSQLYLGVPIFENDIEFLREYPEHALWLKNHLDPKLWAKIGPFCHLPGEAAE